MDAATDPDDDEDLETETIPGEAWTSFEMFEAIFFDPPPRPKPTVDLRPAGLTRDRPAGDQAIVDRAAAALQGPRRTPTDRRAMRAGVARLLHPDHAGHDRFAPDHRILNAAIDDIFRHL